MNMPVIRLIAFAGLFALVFQTAPAWLRGGIVGLCFGILMHMANERNKKIEEYWKRIERLKKRGRNE